MKRTTREWVRKAEADWHGTERLATAPDPFHDLVGFHCQQAAEKYLKALLEESGQAIPKSHDLEGLFNLLQAHHVALRPIRRGLKYLTGFAVDPRYPVMRTTKRQAGAAQRWAGLVRDVCRAILGLA